MATPRSNAKNTVEDMKAALKSLFEEEYYSKQFRVEKWIPNEEDFGLYVPLKTSEGIDLQQKILEDISKPVGPLSTLVLGDSGTGKSWLALKLTKHLYDSSEEQFQNKIPLYIPLGKIENMKKELPSSSKSDILWSYINFHSDSLIELDSDLKFENFYKKLCKAELILILDGFDELVVKVNLWETNEWTSDRFSNRLCTIVLCRPSALLDIDFPKMFGFYKNREQHIPDRYNISLLDKNVVENYISQVPQFLSNIQYDGDYDSQNIRDPTWMMTKSVTSKPGNCKWESNGEDSEYRDWFFVKLPELQRLARNIYILKLICQLLPKLVEDERIRTGQNKTNDEFMDKLEEICRTEVLLYDKFTDGWFTYKVDKFKLKPCAIENVEARCVKSSISDIKSVLVHYMFGYAQNLAMRYARLKAGKISNDEIPASETLYWNLWTPWNPNSLTFSRDIKLEDILFPNNEEDIDEHRVANLQFLRDSCFLRCSSDNRSFSFMHLSLFEYFLSREVFQKFRGALNYYSNWERRKAEDLYFPINQRNINDSEFIGILANLVGRAKVDETFQALLLETVKKSATLPGVEQMASNALTILNLSGYSFSGKMTEEDNFQNIQVPGTNFENSICGNSDFSGANLKGSKFSQGWFQGCKFQGVNFSECSFGQIAPISLASKTCYVLDILCYAEDEFYYVVVCYYEPCRNEEGVDLYIQNYKLTTDFEQQEYELICLVQHMEYDVYSFQCFLTKGAGNVFLFIFSCRNRLQLSWNINIEAPIYWFEFNFNSKLASNEIEMPAFDWDSFVDLLNSSKYVQKFILFYSTNRNPEFCDKERFNREAARRQFLEETKLCCNRYFWMPFGNIKLLVSVGYEGVKNFADANILENVKDVSLLHNAKPVVLLQESNCFEIFWQIFCSSGIEHDIYLQEVHIDRSLYKYGKCVNGNSLLCLSVEDGNNYFFDLLSEKFVDVFEKPSAYSSKFQLLLKSPTHQIIYSYNHVFSVKEHKFQWELDYVASPVVYIISEDLDFVAHLMHAHIEIFNTETGMLSQNVIKDSKSPATFLSIKHGTAITYLLYFHQRSLHFQKLERIGYFTHEIVNLVMNKTKKYFSDDGILSVHVRQQHDSLLLEFYFCKDNDKFRKYFDRRFEVHRNFYVIHNSVLITKNKLVIFYYCLRPRPSGLRWYSDPGSEEEDYNKSSGEDKHCLVAYDAKSKLEIKIDGIPYEKIESRQYATSILQIQSCQKLIVNNGRELSIYTVEELPLLGEMRLLLLYNFSFRCVSGSTDVALDPNFENLVYIFPESVRVKKLQFLDLSKNTGEELAINCIERSDNIATKTKKLSTVLFPDKIIVGYRDSGTFYTVRVMPYKEFAVEDPAHVVSSTRLGWIVAQFWNGDLHIIESTKLKTLLVLNGFHPGYKFHIVDQNSKQFRIILFDFNPNLAFITINADSLREYFEKGCLEKFKDWKVDRGQISSSILSLTDADISYSKCLNKSDKSLFEFHSSVGSSSENEDYHPFCNLFLPVTNYTHSILKVNNAQPCDLTKNWTVTIIAKKKKVKLLKKTIYTATRLHSALLVEGVMHGGHFIIIAELTRPSNKIVKIECESYRGKAKYEEIINKYYGKQIQVVPAIGLKLLKNIWVDTYNPEWKYDLLFHNCNTWIKKKLEILGFGNEFDSKPYRLFLSLPQDFNLESLK